MSFVACGRPFPITQHFDNPTPLKGQPCNEQSACCGGAGRHDSHYACVKFDGIYGQYLPCPPREQPDYDEIVVFNSDVVLPVAAFEFKRRRRTLLWLDDSPQNNYSMLRAFPGCPRHPAALQLQAYPMRPHCTTCGHGLTMDANPYGTLIERQHDVDAAQNECDNVLVAASTGSLDAQARLQSCLDALQLAEAALARAQVAAAAVVGEFAGRDIKMEEQTDVVLFTSVDDMTHFLRAHPELSKWLPPCVCTRACHWCGPWAAAHAAAQVPVVAAAHRQQLQAATRGWLARLLRRRQHLAPQVRKRGRGMRALPRVRERCDVFAGTLQL